MKTILALSLIPATLVAGAAILHHGTRPSHGAQPSDALSPAPARAVLPADPEALSALLADVEQLRTRVTELEMELAGLRAAAERRAVESVVADAPIAARVEPVPAVTRATIERVIEDLRVEEREARRVDREQRELEQTLQRAGYLAERVGLGVEGEKRIADILLAQQQRYRDLRGGLEGVDRLVRKDYLRQGAADINAWRAEQLGTYFDANVAQQLARSIAPKKDKRGDSDRPATKKAIKKATRKGSKNGDDTRRGG